MYESPELFEAALSQLHSIFNQRSDTIKAMDGVQLLMNGCRECVSVGVVGTVRCLSRDRFDRWRTHPWADAFRGARLVDEFGFAHVNSCRLDLCTVLFGSIPYPTSSCGRRQGLPWGLLKGPVNSR